MDQGQSYDWKTISKMWDQRKMGNSKPSSPTFSSKNVTHPTICQELVTDHDVNTRPGIWMSPNLEHCCSLTSDIWKVDLPPTSPSPRDYMRPVHRAIVTIEMDHVALGALPHHPFDRVRPAAYKYGALERKAGGIAVSSRTEVVYAADLEHDQILIFGPDGGLEQLIGKTGELPGQFNQPSGLAYDSVWDRLYVADKNNHRIQVLTSTGQYLFQFGGCGSLPGLMKYPCGLAVSKDGGLVAVADNGNRKVQLFKSDGTIIGNYGITTSTWNAIDDQDKDAFQCLRGVAFDDSGRYIYVTDFMLHCVFQIDIGSGHQEKIIDEAELCRPSGIEVDPYGNLLICDLSNSSVKVFYRDGTLLRRMYCVGGQMFDKPLDVAVHPDGYLVVVDRNGRIRIF